MGEKSLLEQVTAAAEQRRLSENTLKAYRRTWLKLTESFSSVCSSNHQNTPNATASLPDEPLT